MNNDVCKIKQIAFYLPQFHAIPENDQWWGEGFTEWTNVTKAQPLFDGHYQPHVPHESIGYYDLSNPDVLVKQSQLAQEYGIYGFCFYHYWFNGKKLLDIPVDNFLNTKSIDFKYCLCWANENWTRAWDGFDKEVLIAQQHSDDDDIAFILDKIPFFQDERYIRIDDKPVLLIYRTELLPDPAKTAKIWRETMKEMGIGDIYLVRVESFVSNLDPTLIGFDAAVEFTPDWRNKGFQYKKKILNGVGFTSVFDYFDTVMKCLTKEEPLYKRFRSVFPSWDNTPRRNDAGTVFDNSYCDLFEFYLRQISLETTNKFREEEQFVFINAWNEWGEGCHLEPDVKNGFALLEICRRNSVGVFVNQLDLSVIDLYEKYDKKSEEYQSLIKKYENIKKTKAFLIGKTILKPFVFIRNIIKY